MLGLEGYQLGTNTDNSDGINVVFSMQKLKHAIRRGHNTTPGRDGLGHEMFKQMDDLALEEMPSLINTCGSKG